MLTVSAARHGGALQVRDVVIKNTRTCVYRRSNSFYKADCSKEAREIQ